MPSAWSRGQRRVVRHAEELFLRGASNPAQPRQPAGGSCHPLAHFPTRLPAQLLPPRCTTRLRPSSQPPPSAEQVDQGDLPLGAAVDEGDLVEEAAALRIEVAQVVVDATLVACLGQLQGFVAAVRQGAQGLLFATQGIAGRQGVGDLAGKRSGWSPRGRPPPNPSRASARLRLARLRPPSKIGSVNVGRKLQEREPPSNRPDISALEVPKLPVRLMRGRTPRAAPISALRARKRCSAAGCPDVARSARTACRERCPAAASAAAPDSAECLRGIVATQQAPAR